MGCDIHTVLQVKKGAKWETIATDIYDWRNYALFSVLAGVRGSEEPIAEPRGYPKEFKCSNDDIHGHVYVEGEVFQEYWMGDHSHSWLTLEEINRELERCIYWINEGLGVQSEIEYFTSLRYLVSKMVIVAYENGLELEEVRLVFGFDS